VNFPASFPAPLGAHRSALGHAFPVLCRRRVWLSGVLLGPRPSLPRLRELRCPLCSAGSQVLCRVRLLPSYAPQYGYLPFRAGLPSQQRVEFPVLVHVVSRRARAYDYGDSSPSRYRSSRCGLPLGLQVGIPTRFRAQSPGLRCLCLRFRPHLAMVTARLEVRWFAIPFCRAFSSPATCRFIPALRSPTSWR